MYRKTINYLRGMVRIEIKGAYIERFLNICAANQIDFWDVSRPAFDRIEATVRISGFRKLRKYARRAMCRIKIIKKKGLVFLTNRFRYRYALLAGFLSSLIGLWALCGFIWTVSITGCETIPPVEILEGLKRHGFHIGMRASDVDAETLRERLVLDMDNLLWLTVNVNGSHGEIIVREREAPPEILPVKEPCDLIARRDGVIVTAIVKEGISNLASDATVAKGDLLVSGTHVSSLGGIRFVHAMGEITARTWYELTAVFPEPAYEKVRTGRETTHYALVFGGRRINLYLNSGISYESYDKIMDRKNLSLGDRLRLPVSLVTEHYYECETAEVKGFEKTAGHLLKTTLDERLAALLPEGAEVLLSDFSLKKTGDVFTGVLRAECIEEIGEEQMMTEQKMAEEKYKAGQIKNGTNH